MKCESCNKREANTHIKTIINGKVADCMLCSECAKKLGYNDVFNDFFHNSSNSFLDSFFGNFLTKEKTKEKACDFCNTTFDEIAEKGKVGCANCYKVFYDKLMPSIERMHGNYLFHKGKKGSSHKEESPKNNDEMLSKLREQLKEAIELQEFEKAANLRDQIKLIEKQVNQGE